MKKFSNHPDLITIILLLLTVLLTTGAATQESTQPKKDEKQIIHTSLPASIASLTDPTRPPDALISPEKSLTIAGPLVLSAIFYYSSRQSAIINGQLVAPGDTIGEYTIINIHRDTVELIGAEGNELTLILIPKIKQPTNKKGS